MSSRPLLLLGNIVAIIVTITAFLQAVSWSIAGVLILVSLVFPLLANLSRGALTSQPATGLQSQTDTKTLQHRPTDKHTTPTHQSSTKTDQRSSSKQESPKTLGPKAGPKFTSSTINAPKLVEPKLAPAPRPTVVRQGPNFNPTIAKGDYAEYEVELDSGKEFSGEATANGLVNVYLLDEDNLDNLDQGEEFWSETGEEGVENAELEFTAPSNGTWFFVVENADDRAVSVTVKIQKGQVSTTPA